MVYQIKVQGQIDSSWSDWFHGMEVTSEMDRGNCWITTLTGNIVDQAAMRGLMNQLWDMNMTILSVLLIDPSLKPVNGDR